MNPYLKQLDELQAARKAWEDSEWVLHFLRTITSTDPPKRNDKDILLWYHSIPARH